MKTTRMFLWALMALVIVFLTTCGGGGSKKNNCCDGPTAPQLFTSTYVAEATATATATCPDGTIATATGYAKITVTATSTISQSDADAKAKAQAEAEAKNKAEATARAEVKCGPTQVCDFSVPNELPAFSCEGTSNGSIVVGATSGCAWTATSNASWINITSGTSGNGNGTVVFTVSNNSGSARTGIVTVAGKTVTVTQSPCSQPACEYAVPPETPDFSWQGSSNGSIIVGATSGCAWTATTSTPWLAITGGANGIGNGSVQFTVGGNPGAARVGTIVIAGKTVNVPQEAHP